MISELSLFLLSFHHQFMLIVPLRCGVETLVGSYWVYFYEGCIGVLKVWPVRAVSAALDEGQETLTLDCLHDHIRPSDILRQMALDVCRRGAEPRTHGKQPRTS